MLQDSPASPPPRPPAPPPQMVPQDLTVARGLIIGLAAVLALVDAAFYLFDISGIIAGTGIFVLGWLFARSFRVTLRPDGLAQRRWFGNRDVAFAHIDRVEAKGLNVVFHLRAVKLGGKNVVSTGPYKDVADAHRRIEAALAAHRAAAAPVP